MHTLGVIYPSSSSENDRNGCYIVNYRMSVLLCLENVSTEAVPWITE